MSYEAGRMNTEVPTMHDIVNGLEIPCDIENAQTNLGDRLWYFGSLEGSGLSYEYADANAFNYLEQSTTDNITTGFGGNYANINCTDAENLERNPVIDLSYTGVGDEYVLVSYYQVCLIPGDTWPCQLNCTGTPGIDYSCGNPYETQYDVHTIKVSGAFDNAMVLIFIGCILYSAFRAWVALFGVVKTDIQKL